MAILGAAKGFALLALARARYLFQPQLLQSNRAAYHPSEAVSGEASRLSAGGRDAAIEDASRCNGGTVAEARLIRNLPNQ